MNRSSVFQCISCQKTIRIVDLDDKNQIKTVNEELNREIEILKGKRDFNEELDVMIHNDIDDIYYDMAKYGNTSKQDQLQNMWIKCMRINNIKQDFEWCVITDK